MFIKSSEAESHGLLGHYCLFTITNYNTQATELFAVDTVPVAVNRLILAVLAIMFIPN